jgi:hypothetical protein
MIGKVGDRIVVESEQVGQEPREGEILAADQLRSGPQYRVRWDDGHESFFMPKAGNARIIAALRPKRRKRSA